MAFTAFHPAPGLGDLLPGFFVVPQNPITTPGTALVPTLQGLNGNRITKRSGIGDLLPGSFIVPQNPLRDALTGGMSGLGCGSGCGGGCGGPYTLNGLRGLGDGTFSGVTDWLQEPSMISDSVPNWMLFGGAALAAYWLLSPGGSKYRSAVSSERGYKRVARGIGSAASSAGR